MHTFRHRVVLRTIDRRFGFLVTKNVLQRLHNFIFKFRALIGMECLRRSEDIPDTLFTRAFAMVCSFLSGSATGTTNRVRLSMIVSAYEHFSPVGDTDSVLYSTGSIDVGMGDQRVGDLWVTWTGDAVFSVVGRHDNPDTRF